MIVPFHLNLGKFYCIGVMNQLKIICFFIHIKTSYYWFNRQELLQKAKVRYHNGVGKDKVAEYYIASKYVLKEIAKSRHRNLSEEEKEAKRKYGQNRYRNMKQKTS